MCSRVRARTGHESLSLRSCEDHAKTKRLGLIVLQAAGACHVHIAIDREHIGVTKRA